jgi:transcriptional regulator with XRE-family HTH domain/Zn-dependent peptidase ImmA (M78 family)
MSEKGQKNNEKDGDLFDEPLPRYAASDAIIELPDGTRVDLHALRHPFTGERSEPGGLAALRSPDEDAEEAEERALIGRRLRALRENHDLSQLEVAEAAGMPVQRVSDVERGRGDLGLSFITTLLRAMDAELADIAGPDAPEVSTKALTRIAQAAGAPRAVLSRIERAVPPRQFADALVRAFAWTRQDLFAGTPRSAVPDIAVAFKSGKRLPPADSPVIALARTLSIMSASLHDGRRVGVPGDPAQLRQQVLATSGQEVTLDRLLNWTWNAGVIVLPLAGSGDFAAAVWLVDEQPVIVLKESRSFGAYWLFDLAHELAHLALGHVEMRGIVEVGAPSKADLDDEQEAQANTYALDLLLPDPGAMLTEVRRRTAGDAPKNFKFAVEAVARRTNVSAGLLGIIAAHEMSDVPEDKDRWGSANNLAKGDDPDGRARVAAAFGARMQLSDLDALDAALLQALSVSS